MSRGRERKGEEEEEDDRNPKRKRDEVEQEGWALSKRRKLRRAMLQRLAMVDMPEDVILHILTFLSLHDAVFRMRPVARAFEQQVTILFGNHPLQTLTWSIHFNPERKQSLPQRETNLLDSALQAFPNLFHNGRALDLSQFTRDHDYNFRLITLLQLLAQCWSTLETLIVPQGHKRRQAFAVSAGLTRTEIRDSLTTRISRQVEQVAEQEDKTEQEEFFAPVLKTLNTFGSWHDDDNKDTFNTALMFSALAQCSKLERVIWANNKKTPIRPMLQCIQHGKWPALTELHCALYDPWHQLGPLLRHVSDGKSTPQLRHLVLHFHKHKMRFPATLEACTQFGTYFADRLETLVLSDLPWTSADYDAERHHQPACTKLRALVGSLTNLRQFGMNFDISHGEDTHMAMEYSSWDAETKDNAGNNSGDDMLWKIMETVVQQNAQLHRLGGLAQFIDYLQTRFMNEGPRAFQQSVRAFPLLKRTVLQHKALQTILLSVRDTDESIFVRNVFLVAFQRQIAFFPTSAMDDWRTWTMYKPERTFQPRRAYQNIPLKSRYPQLIHQMVVGWPWMYGRFPIDIDRDFVDNLEEKVRSLMQKDVVVPWLRIPNPGKTSLDEHGVPVWNVTDQHPQLSFTTRVTNSSSTQVIPKGSLLFAETGFAVPFNAASGEIPMRATAMLFVHGYPKTAESKEEKLPAGFKPDDYCPFFGQCTLKKWNAMQLFLFQHVLVARDPTDSTLRALLPFHHPRTLHDFNKLGMAFFIVLPRLTMLLRSTGDKKPTTNGANVNVRCKLVPTPSSVFACACIVEASRDIQPHEELVREDRATFFEAPESEMSDDAAPPPPRMDL